MKDLDDRLRDAGSAWRDDHRDTTEPDLARITGGRRRVLLPLAAAVAVVALVVAGALALRGSDKDDLSAAGLVGPVWKLDGGGASTFVIGRDGQLVADDECSLIGGRARLDGQQLTVADRSERVKGCVDSYNPLFGRIFERTVTVTVDGEHATLTGGGKTLRATKAPQFIAPTLDLPAFTDTQWQLTSVRNSAGVAGEVTSAASLEIRNGRMRYFDLCNKRTAPLSYGYSRGRPGSVTDYGSPIVDCTADVATTTVNEVLGHVFAWKIAGSALTVSSSRGSLTYRWAPQFFPAVDPSRLVGPTWRLTSVAGEAATQEATLRFPTVTTYEFVSVCGTLRGSARIAAGFLDLDVKRECRGQFSTVTSFITSEAPWRIAGGRLVVGGGGAQAFSVVFAGQVSDPARELQGAWDLDSIVDPNGTTTPGRAGVALQFEDRQVTVYGTCVPRSGTYRVESDRIMAMSRGAQAACGEGGGPAADLYESVFGGGFTWSVRDTALTLRDGATTLAFTRADDAPLSGTWRLQSAEQRSGGTSSGQGASRSGATLTFADGRYMIRGLCTTRQGSYTTTPDTLSVVSSLGPACLTTGLPGVLERTFLGNLNWSVREQILTLRKGSTTLTFTR